MVEFRGTSAHKLPTINVLGVAVLSVDLEFAWMRGCDPYTRLVWSDRFQTPDAKRLREGLSSSTRNVFDAARKRLLEIEGVREDLAWHGDCWRWTIEFRTRLSREPLAVLIPSPDDLQLALPMDHEFSNSLSTKRMKRAVRDGLEMAREPFDTRWGVWSLTGTGLLDDLQDLIELKLVHLAKRAG